MSKQGFINDYLHFVFKGFKASIDAGKPLRFLNDECRIKMIDYRDDEICDYNDETMQQLYILKYGYAYFWEYIQLYEQALYKIAARKDAPDVINVLSIGAGSGLDFYALRYSMEKLKLNESIHVNYIPFDSTKWIYYHDLQKDNIASAVRNIYELRGIEYKYSICIFPKSIGEIDERTYREIIYYLCDNCSDRMILINSLRNGHQSFDKTRFDNFAYVISAVKRYNFNMKEMEVQKFTADDMKIDGLYGEEYEYPEDIKEYFYTLFDNCNEYNNGKCKYKEECRRILEDYPLLKTGQLSYQIAELYKNDNADKH